VHEIRQADLPGDREAVERLWLAYLAWGNDAMEAAHGFRLPVEETVERDIASIEKFQPPRGRLLLALKKDDAIATAALQRIGPDTAEIKRMFVVPSARRAGLGRAMLEHLVAAARTAGYQRVRLDTPDFMTAAHALYRSSGFAEIPQYEESEIPPRYRAYWLFMELPLR